eukprot:1737639-Amphidinium_carterae.1
MVNAALGCSDSAQDPRALAAKMQVSWSRLLSGSVADYQLPNSLHELLRNGTGTVFQVALKWLQMAWLARSLMAHM